MNWQDWVTPAVFIFMAGIIFQAGRFTGRLDAITERVSKLESDVRREMAELKGILIPVARRRYDDLQKPT